MKRDAMTRARLLEERGAFTWVTMLLLLLLVAGGYLAWVWGPIYLVHVEVKQVVRDYANQSIKNPNDEVLVQGMTHKIRSLDTTTVEGADGRQVRLPSIDLQPQDVTWKREGNELHVAFEYVRQVTYPFLERTVEKTFQVDMTMDITRPDWGPAR
jgi:hypothetical protein